MGKSFVSRARDLGRTHGTNAAEEWLFAQPYGVRAGKADYLLCRSWAASMLADIDSGKADIPYSDLSGEWADGYTPQQLARDIGYNAEHDKREEHDFLCSTLCEAYESEFGAACLEAIEKDLRALLDPNAAQASR